MAVSFFNFQNVALSNSSQKCFGAVRSIARNMCNAANVSTKLLIIKPTTCTSFSNLFWTEIYIFRTVPLSIIRSFSLYTKQWYTSYRFADSLQAGAACKLSGNRYDLYHCCVYSEKLLMMDRGIVQNIYSSFQNKFEKLV